MDKAVQSVPVGKHVHYERRRPEETTLYTLVQEHLESFFVQVERIKENKESESFKKRFRLSSTLLPNSQSP
jgi:hypothetical protein